MAGYAFSSATGLTDWVMGKNSSASAGFTLASFTPNAGDIGILIVDAYGQSGTQHFSSVPAGWTEVGYATQGSNAEALVFVNPSLSAGAQAPAWSGYGYTSATFAWALGCFTGQYDTVTAANNLDFLNGVTGSNVTSFATTGGAHTTALAGELLVAFVAGGGTTVRTYSSSSAQTPASGWAAAETNTAGGAHNQIFLQHNLSSAGAGITPTDTIALNSTIYGVGVMLAFKSAPPAQTVSPSGFAQTRHFGSPTVAGPVSPSGFANTRHYGSPTVTPGAVSVAPSGFAQTRAFGTPVLAQVVAPSGFANTRGYGSPAVTPGAVTASPSGFAHARGYGSPTLTSVATIAPAGFAHTQALGAPTVTPGSVSVAPAGFARTRAFGTPTALSVATVAPAGFAHARHYGAPALTSVATVSPAGLARGWYFGTPRAAVDQAVLPAGFAHPRGYGAPRLREWIPVLSARLGFDDPVTAWLVADDAGAPTGSLAFGDPLSTWLIVKET